MSFNETLKWTLGLIGSNGKYLTAETFGNQLNISGQFLRKKQIFTLEQNPGTSVAYFLTPNGKYLSCGPKGELTGTADSKGKDEEWTITPLADGRWALKGTHGYYFSGTDAGLNAFAREVGDNEKWTIHLAMHPQVAVRNVNRKAYVHLSEDGKELTTDETIPWGSDALITFEFQKGRYCLRASNNKVLDKSGKLVDAVNDDSLFIIEFHESQIALKASDGKYLQGYGPKGSLQARRTAVGKDELFELEDSAPQVTLTGSNGKKLSTRQTEDVKANQAPSDIADTEIFQVEDVSGKFVFRGQNGKVWSTSDNGAVKLTGTTIGETEKFEIVWLGHQVAIKASNGKFVASKPNGSLVASGDDVEDISKFTFTLINRPQLVLRSEFGFVAAKVKDVVQCNAVDHEIITLEANEGVYAFKSANGKYWKLDGDHFVANGTAPDQFHLEFLSHSRFAIKHVGTGKYLKGEHQGNFKPNATTAGKDELWEY